MGGRLWTIEMILKILEKTLLYMVIMAQSFSIVFQPDMAQQTKSVIILREIRVDLKSKSFSRTTKTGKIGKTCNCRDARCCISFEMHHFYMNDSDKIE